MREEIAQGGAIGQLDRVCRFSRQVFQDSEEKHAHAHRHLWESLVYRTAIFGGAHAPYICARDWCSSNLYAKKQRRLPNQVDCRVAALEIIEQPDARRSRL